jgi:pSer/pThr/pTyr-binding forkhead associated (FHA) protein
VIKCSTCGAVYPKNTLYCIECGQRLVVADNATGKLPAESETIQTGNPAPAALAITGPGSQTTEAILLNIGHRGPQIQLSLVKEVLLGRTDPRTGVHPDLDLTPYDGLEMGVSRQHARLRRADGAVVIEDLGSANGTFCNGRRLLPHHTQALQDGDELRLGKLILEVHLADGGAHSSSLQM